MGTVMVMHGSISQRENRISPLSFCFFTVCYSLLYHSPIKWWVMIYGVFLLFFFFQNFYWLISFFFFHFVLLFERMGERGKKNESKSEEEKKRKRWSKFEPRRLLFHHQLRLSLSKLYHFPSFNFEPYILN